jgi:hypothetical protein
MPEAKDSNSLAYRRAEADAHDLKLAIQGAIRRQADAWGVRFDQAQALLLDRKAIA